MNQTLYIDEWIRSLRQLGCSEELTAQIARQLEACQLDKASELLRRHKIQLLNELHNSEQKVDLLDFLLYQIKKLQNSN